MGVWWSFKREGDEEKRGCSRVLREMRERDGENGVLGVSYAFIVMGLS